MQHRNQFRLDTPIDEVMRACPETISVLINRNLQCVGCILACFHSVEEAAYEHNQDADALLKVLNETLARSIR